VRSPSAPDVEQKNRNDELGVLAQEIHALIDSQATSHLAAIVQRITKETIIKKALAIARKGFSLRITTSFY